MHSTQPTAHNPQSTNSNLVLITGCSKGIGHGLAEQFAKGGWTVYATARNPQSPLLVALSETYSNIHTVALDVLDESSILAVREQLEREQGKLDLLINNAAIFPGEGSEKLEELDPTWFDEAFSTNVTGVVRVSTALLPLLRKSQCPRIVNISSGAGSISTKTDYAYYPYGVSKAALNMLTRAMAAELMSEKIVVTAISPGWVKTEMGGPNALITVDESTTALYQTITHLTPEDAGKFLNYDGKRNYCQW